MTVNRYERTEQFVVVWHGEAGFHAAHGPYSFREAQDVSRRIPDSVVVALTSPVVEFNDEDEEWI